MRTNGKEHKAFLMSWQEYELMVTRILPKFIVRGLFDLSDDLHHMLFCRDEIERFFDENPDDPKLVPHRLKVLSLDIDLFLMRREVLARLPKVAFHGHRKRNKTPRSHWWWYLDEVESDGAELPRPRKPKSRVRA